MTMSKKVKAKNLEMLDKFLTEQNTTEVLQEKEYSTRRDKKIQRKKEIEKDRKLLYFKYLYIPSIVGIMSGTVLIFGSTIRTVSEGSIFWAHRKLLHVIGPTLLGLGVLFLFLGVGLVNRREKQMRKTNTCKIQNSFSMGTTVYNSIESITVGRQSSVQCTSSGFSNSRKSRHEKLKTISRQSSMQSTSSGFSGSRDSRYAKLKTISRQSSVQSTSSGFSGSRESRYARLKHIKWRSTDLVDNKLLLECVTDSELKQQKDVEQKQQIGELQIQKEDGDQKGEQDSEQETDISSIGDLDITNECVTEVWIKRSDLCTVVNEQRKSRQHIDKSNKKNFVKINKPFNLSVHSGMETKIKSSRNNAIRKSSVENKMSCQIYIE